MQVCAGPPDVKMARVGPLWDVNPSLHRKDEAETVRVAAAVGREGLLGRMSIPTCLFWRRGRGRSDGMAVVAAREGGPWPTGEPVTSATCHARWPRWQRVFQYLSRAQELVSADGGWSDGYPRIGLASRFAYLRRR